MSLTQDSNRGAHEVSSRWRRSGGMRSRPLARSGGGGARSGGVWSGGFSDDGVKFYFILFFYFLFFFIAVGFVAGCGGFLMWVSVGFDFRLPGFWFRVGLVGWVLVDLQPWGEVIDGFHNDLLLLLGDIGGGGYFGGNFRGGGSGGGTNLMR